MDINSIMVVYNTGSVWNAINPINRTTSVPLVNDIDSDVNELYKTDNFLGQTADSELQDIYQQVEPSYGIPVTYDKNGNITIPSDTTLPTDGLSSTDSSIIPLLNSNNSADDSSMENILSQYSSVESGALESALSSIFSDDPYNAYNAVDALGTDQLQNIDNTIIDTLI